MDAPIGVVRVHHDGEVGAAQRFELSFLVDLPTLGPEGGRVFVVGRAQDRGFAGRTETRNQLDRRLRAGERHHGGIAAVRFTGGGDEFVPCPAGRKALPRGRGHVRHGIGHLVDARREVDPLVLFAAEAGGRGPDIAAVIAGCTCLH